MKNYNIKMRARDQVKTMLATRAMTMTKLAEIMTEKTGKVYSPNNLSGKLGKNMLRYSEMQLICEILDFSIDFRDNTKC